MITRSLSSATIGLAVTTGLLYVMQVLISTGETVMSEPRERLKLIWIDPPEPPDTPVETPPPEKIDKPPLPPKIEPLESMESAGIGAGVTATAPRPPTMLPGFDGIASSDGPLINIIKVQPQYPSAAEARGLSGTVLVRYDVTPMGTVENVEVIESTNRVFDKAAVQAALRFKYKPRTVDGIPYGATGLEQLFRFEMKR